MIIAHTIAGAAAGNYLGYFWYFFIGSIIPDVDHIYVLLKNKIFTFNKIVDSIRFEEKYNLHFKTKLVHSLLGAVIFSAPLLIVDAKGAAIFFVSYVFHLILDWFDSDIKYYLYPLDIKFKGFLPIFSKQEIFFTFLLMIAFVLSF